jgi:hypothetical protein
MSHASTMPAPRGTPGRPVSRQGTTRNGPGEAGQGQSGASTLVDSIHTSRLSAGGGQRGIPVSRGTTPSALNGDQGDRAQAGKPSEALNVMPMKSEERLAVKSSAIKAVLEVDEAGGAPVKVGAMHFQKPLFLYACSMCVLKSAVDPC